MVKRIIIPSLTDDALARAATAVAPPPLQRRLLVFIVGQSALSTLIGFATVFVYARGGMAAALGYIAVFLVAVLLGITLPFVLGRWWPMQVRQVCPGPTATARCWA
jgi:hypothetical protein